MAKRTCEICGRPTAEADFSKSYKRRCKECVAREAREARQGKAEDSDTLLDIDIPGTVLDAQPNWEQRRYDVALKVFFYELDQKVTPRCAAQHARQYADWFINEMRGNES